MKATTATQHHFSPQMIRAAAILRMEGYRLAHFLRHCNNPALITGNLPPLDMQHHASDNNETIRDVLYQCVADSPPRDVAIVAHLEALIESVEDDGFLMLDDEDNADEADSSDSNFAAAITYLQSIAPAGVAARSYAECILLQLARKPASNARSAAQNLVQNHFHWLSRKRWDKLPQRHLAAALEILKTTPATPPVPTPPAPPSLPDAIVTHKKGLWKVQAGAGTLLNPSAVRAKPNIAADYQAAKEIVMAVRNRHQWVLRVCQYVVDAQIQFFNDSSDGNDSAAVRPLPLAAIARDLQVSSGFISHVIKNKQILAPNGSFQLKWLTPRDDSVIVRHKIKTMINHEDKHTPLTDTELCRRLTQQGISLKRRAVSKQRARAGFLPASLRKHFIAPRQPAATVDIDVAVDVAARANA